MEGWPYGVKDFAEQTPLGVSWFFWIVVVLYVLAGFVLYKTAFGRRVYAIGSNAEVARLKGVMDTDRLALAKSLGATGTIEAAKEDLKQGLTRLTGSEKNIDVFYDCVGEKGLVLNNILAVARRGSRIVVISVLQKQFNIPLLPDFVQHELSLSGTTMYVPQDYRDMIDFMGRGVIRTEGMVSHHFPLEKIPDVLDMIVNHREKTFKVIIDVAES